MGLYSQQFIFFTTYECAKNGRVLHYTRLESFATKKQSSLLDPFVRCKENEVLRIQYGAVFITHHFHCNL